MKKLIGTIDKILEYIMNSRIILWIMLVIASFAFGILCLGKTIWLDEALTGTFIRYPFGEMIQITASDVHPPLYYIIVKIAISLFGDHLWVIKLFSFLPFILMLVITACKVAKMIGNSAAFILSALLCIAPCIIVKHAEMRMYPWAMFFVFAFAVFLYSAIQSNKKSEWIFAVIMGVCAAYTHYYALVGVAFFYILLFLFNIKLREIRRKFYCCVLTSSILYAPWLIVLLRQTRTISETGWWNEANLSVYNIVVGYIAWPFADNAGIIQYLFLGILVVALVYSLFNGKVNHKSLAYCAIGAYLAVILSGIMITVLFAPVFISRFLYPCVGILLLGISILLSKWDKKITVCLLVIFLFFGMKTYNSELHYRYDSESIPNLESFVDENDLANTVYLYDNDADKVIVKYFYPEAIMSLDSKADKELVDNKQIYYFVCDKEKPDEDILNKLGYHTYELINHVNIQFHGFDIYRISK